MAVDRVENTPFIFLIFILIFLITIRWYPYWEVSWRFMFSTIYFNFQLMIYISVTTNYGPICSNICMVQKSSYFMIAWWQLHSFLSFYRTINSSFGKDKSECWDNSVKIIILKNKKSTYNILGKRSALYGLKFKWQRNYIMGYYNIYLLVHISQLNLPNAE